MLVALERITAYQFRETVSLMSRRGSYRAHFVEIDRQARFRQLPSRFGSCQATADYLKRAQISV